MLATYLAFIVTIIGFAGSHNFPVYQGCPPWHSWFPLLEAAGVLAFFGSLILLGLQAGQ